MSRGRFWLERIDPDRSRRYKGLRLVAAYGLGAWLGSLLSPALGSGASASLALVTGNFALWASVSESRVQRAHAALDLVLLCAAATLGALLFIALLPWLNRIVPSGPELTLVTGAFLAGSLKRFGLLGAGVGSQLYIGQLLAYGTGLTGADVPAVLLAGLAAAVATLLPRALIGPAHQPLPPPAPSILSTGIRGIPGELAMGLQAAIGALAVVVLDAAFHLQQPAWAITACTYVIAGTASGTALRVRQRILGTWVGVLLALACLPIAEQVPLLAWSAAAVAMVLYALTLPDRYDIPCGAFAFTLVLTLAASGEHSVPLLASRAWETTLGGALGLLSARFVMPLKPGRTKT